MFTPRSVKVAREMGEQVLDGYAAAWADGNFDADERTAHEARLRDLVGELRFADASDALLRGVGRARSKRHLTDLFGAVLAAADEAPERAVQREAA